MKTKINIIIIMAAIAASCSRQPSADAYGNFEATETTISAEANGRILYFSAEEGSVLQQGDTIGLIDTTDLHLKRNQLLAQRAAMASRRLNLDAQAAVYSQQQQNLEKDRVRISALVKEQAATPKQLDDIEGALALAKRQGQVVNSQYSGLNDELRTLDVQLKQVEESLRRCYIVNPVKGTVLTRLAEAGEVTAFGKPLYRIADLSTMELRVYISGNMLSQIKTGETAAVLIDSPDGLKELQGTITWVSPSAEFTPKIIQTRDERVNLVYAVKLRVINDGSLKIAMPAEVNFSKAQSAVNEQ